MKKIIAIILSALMLAATLTACNSSKNETPTNPDTSSTTSTSPDATPSAEPDQVESKGTLLMATTTSTDNTGLLDYLAPIFQKETGWELKWTAVGTGAAIQLGKDGEVEIIMVHAKAREEAFVDEGYGVERFEIMYNDFVIVGPADGAVAYTNDVAQAFTQMFDESLIFVSRGDDSGTHTKEKNIWGVESIDYESNPNYISAGSGMTDTIVMADEMEGYCLTDRATWLTTMRNVEYGISLEIICEGDTDLFNQYGVIAVNPEMYPDVNLDGANAFIDWICSDEIQALIAEFGIDTYGQALFTPNAA